MRRTTRLQRKTLEELERSNDVPTMIMVIILMIAMAILIAAAVRAYGPDQPANVPVDARDPMDVERWRN